MTTAYPLSWPDHIDRHRTREQGRFKTSLSSALNNVRAAWAEAEAAWAASAAQTAEHAEQERMLRAWLRA